MASSGHIRQSLASLKRHLSDRMDRANRVLNFNIPDVPSEREQLWSELHEVSLILVNSIANIKASDERWVEFISSLNNAPEVQAEQKVYADHTAGEAGYLNVLAEAETLVSRLETRQKVLERRGFQQTPSIADFGGGLRPPVTQQQHRPANRTIKPPKIALPEFEGDVLKWREFWSIFCINIHDRPELSKAEKFSYLHKALKGVAKKAIGGILVEEQLYDDAVALLKDRFDKAADQLVPILHSKFRQIPQCGYKREHKWETYDECEQIFRQLKALGEEVDNVRSMSFDYLAKFPVHMVEDLFRHYEVNTNSSLAELRPAIHKSITDSEAKEVFLNNLSLMQKGNADPLKRNRGNDCEFVPAERATNSSLAAISKSGDGSSNALRHQTFSNSDRSGGWSNRSTWNLQQSQCFMCGERHSNAKCNKYPTGRARANRIFELGRCLKCGTSYHVKATCPHTVRCAGCNSDQHATFLCFKTFPEEFRVPNQSQFQNANRFTFNQQAQPTKREPSKFEFDKATANSQSEHAMTTLNSSANHQALLQTATTEIVNRQTGRRLKIRLGIDSFSNRSYITEEAARKLGIESKVENRLKVSVFGSDKSVEVPTQRVEFGIAEREGNIRSIQANTTRVISESSVLPPNLPEKETTYLRKLGKLLADDPFVPGGLDVLIGADYAWDFIIEGKMENRVCPSIFVIPTTLGLMLGGRIGCAEEQDDAATLLCICDAHAQCPSELSSIAQSMKPESHFSDVDEFCELEKVCPSEQVVNDEKAIAHDNFKKTLKFEDGLEWVNALAVERPIRNRGLRQRAKSQVVEVSHTLGADTRNETGVMSKQKKPDAGRKKVWVLLFSCLVIWAIHLEPANCSANASLLAFEPFVGFGSRRGLPSKTFSDNVAQFKLVSILGDLGWKHVPTGKRLAWRESRRFLDSVWKEWYDESVTARTRKPKSQECTGSQWRVMFSQEGCWLPEPVQSRVQPGPLVTGNLLPEPVESRVQPGPLVTGNLLPEPVESRYFMVYRDCQ